MGGEGTKGMRAEGVMPWRLAPSVPGIEREARDERLAIERVRRMDLGIQWGR